MKNKEKLFTRACVCIYNKFDNGGDKNGKRA